jgi:histidinol-phosphate aminotransferase
MAKKIESYTAQEQSGILLNANESTLNLSEEIKKEISEAVLSIDYNRYPDNSQKEILDAYAKVMDLQPEQLLAGNGSDEMLGLLIGTFLGKGKSLYTFDPDFSMYNYYASAYEAAVETYDLPFDGTLDLDGFIKHGKEKNVSLVMFSNPNNPTGTCLNIDDVKKLVEAFAPVPVVVDEAYFEFSKEVSALSLLDQYDNLYVTRTLSKAYCIAGVRLGFLVSCLKNMNVIRPMAVPYSLNRVSMEIGVIVLRHAAEIQKQIALTKKRRDEMYQQVKDFKNLYFYPSQANFLHGSCEHKDVLLDLFEKENIVIRNYQGKNTFRITIGSEEENQKVLQVLKQYEEEFA